MLKPFPQHCHSRFAVATALQKAAQAGNPADGLPQEGRRRRRGGRVMNSAVERPPFFQCQEHWAGQLRQSTAEQGGIQDAPRQAAIERQTALQAVGGLQLAGFDATATLEHLMPDLNAKAPPRTTLPAPTPSPLWAPHG